MIKPTPKNQQKSPYFKDNFISSYLIVGANFSEARVRRNSSPQPPPSAAPERISERFAKLRQQFRSKWVRAKFRIRDHSRQVKFLYNATQFWTPRVFLRYSPPTIVA